MSFGRSARSWFPYAPGSGAPYHSYGAGSHSQDTFVGQSTSVASAVFAEGSPVRASCARSGVVAVAASTTRWPVLVVRAAPLVHDPEDVVGELARGPRVRRAAVRRDRAVAVAGVGPGPG